MPNNIDISQKQQSNTDKLTDEIKTTVELSPRDIEAQAERKQLEIKKNIDIATKTAMSEREIETSKLHQPALRRSVLNHKQRDISYNRTMERVHSEIQQPGRAFSKFIHIRIVETISDALGTTVARPNAILIGSIFAFVLTLFIYLISKTIGYKMSGFETIGSFVIGWVLGNIYDYFKLLIKGKNSQ